MSIKGIIGFIILIALVAAGWFFFHQQITAFFENTTSNLQQVENFNFQNAIKQVTNQVLAPLPLNIGGKANNATLTSQGIITETNVQRQENGNLPALTENVKLDASAMAKAQDLFANQYFEHVSPSGVGPGDLAKKYGYDYILEGENLILGNFASEKEVVQDWMNSPGHRANILNNRFTEIGVAIIKGTYKGDTVWIGVQEFGLPLSTCQQPSVVLKAQVDADKAKLDQLSNEIAAKKADIDNTDPHASEYNQLVDEYNKLMNQYNPLVQTTKSLVSEFNDQVSTFNTCVKGSS